MENKIETMTEEVIEVAEEVVTPTSGKALKVALGAGVVLIVGRIIYKKVIKPRLEAAKAKKEDVYATEEDVDDYDGE